MKKQIKLANSFKAVKAMISGKSMISGSNFYDSNYPLSKFLSYNKSKIHIRCILCGFPRTGTHWIRNVIENSSGEKTFNLYDNKPTQNDKNALLVKIHARSKLIAMIKALWLLPPFSFGGKYIYVYRDPRDAIISLYEMYKKEKNNAGLDSKDYLNSQDPIGQYKWEINSWVTKKHNNVLLVKFEDLKISPTSEFQRIFDFLDIKVPVKIKSVNKMVNTEDSSQRPRGTAYGWKNAPKEYSSLISTVSKRLREEIDMLGYEI
jgi:hypothetical protein